MSAEQTEKPVNSNQIIEIYGRYRDYVQHEDRLINDRISRTLLVHGFLLASYVLLLQSRVEVVAKCLQREAGCTTQLLATMPKQLNMVLLLSDIILPIIALIGLLTTLSAQRGVWAAHQAIIALKEKWNMFLQDLGNINYLGLPELTGGGSDKLTKVGGEASANLLLYLAIMWSAIVIISLVSATVWNTPALAEKLLTALN